MRFPVPLLGCQAVRPAPVTQDARPAQEGVRGHRLLDTPSEDALPVRGGQFVEQNTPGHGVHRKVVGGEEQRNGTLAGSVAEQHGTQQRTCSDVHGLVGGAEVLLQACAVLIGVPRDLL